MPITTRSAPTFGVFLNLGANLASTADAVFELTLRQAEAAEALGYHDLWVTEHHVIDFGINPSALTTAAFLLGRTRRIRVGTAVVLSPLVGPVDLAERVALLDQWSDGRFDLGLGRGGYRRDYEVLDIDMARWDPEPVASVEALLELWTEGSEVRPPVRTRPHPPMLLATSSEEGLACAAEHGLALQHYFATPAPARVAVEERYTVLRGDVDQPPPAHLHTLIVVVTDEPDEVRDRLAGALTESFRAGDHPMVPQAPDRHVQPDGSPVDRDALAGAVARDAIVGPPSLVVDQLGRFLETTGARRLALYHEAVADAEITMTSIERFATEVAPRLTA